MIKQIIVTLNVGIGISLLLVAIYSWQIMEYIQTFREFSIEPLNFNCDILPTGLCSSSQINDCQNDCVDLFTLEHVDQCSTCCIKLCS